MLVTGKNWDKIYEVKLSKFHTESFWFFLDNTFYKHKCHETIITYFYIYLCYTFAQKEFPIIIKDSIRDVLIDDYENIICISQ